MKIIHFSFALCALLVTAYSAATVQVISGKDQFDKVVLKNDNPVVVKFGAPWCPACTRSKAPYEKASNDPELADVTFVEMDFDSNSPVAQEYDVQSLPTFLYFYKGKRGATKTGFSENLKSEIANTVASVKKNDEAPATSAAAQTPQDQVNGAACNSMTDGGIMQSISDFFSSVWNTITGWFK